MELWCHGIDRRTPNREAYPNTTYFTTDRLWNVVGLNPVLCNDDPTPKHLNHGKVTNLSEESDAVCPNPKMERESSPETSPYICNVRRYQNNRSSDCLQNISCLYLLLQDGAKVSWHSVFKMFPLMSRVFLRHSVQHGQGISFGIIRHPYVTLLRVCWDELKEHLTLYCK